MALKNSIVEADGILVDREYIKRNLRDVGESNFNLVETVIEETYEWYAVTEVAAVAWQTLNAQPDQELYPTSTYSYHISRRMTQMDGFICRRLFVQKTVEFDT